MISENEYRYITYFSYQNKYVYFKLYKNASSSISRILLKKTRIEKSTYKNIVYGNSVEQMNPFLSDFQDLFKFVFVRNPWDRLVSLFFDKVSSKKRSMKKVDYYNQYKNQSFDSFLESIMDCDLQNCIPHHRLQTSLFPLDNVDYIGKIENFKEDFDFVLKKLNITDYKIPFLNKSIHKNYRTYYNSYTRDLVNKNYEADIDKLKYTF